MASKAKKAKPSPTPSKVKKTSKKKVEIKTEPSNEKVDEAPAKIPGMFLIEKPLEFIKGKQRYDLPLDQSSGTYFLILLISLMTFLALMAVCATMVLGGITKHWSSGLENRLTIEIPALQENGDIRSMRDIQALSREVDDILDADANVKNHEVMSEDDINALVAPWLGDDVVLGDIPLPGLVSVHLNAREAYQLERLEGALKDIAGDIRLDTHESWLEDILNLAGTLQLSAFLVTLMIIFTTITAVAGAIRSRMAEHKADIELLHLMGASDFYIAKQLQRHALVLTARGSLIGVVCGFVMIGVLAIAHAQSENGLLPGLRLEGLQVLSLFMLPLILSLIAAFTARFTVLRVLGKMP